MAQRAAAKVKEEKRKKVRVECAHSGCSLSASHVSAVAFQVEAEKKKKEEAARQVQELCCPTHTR